MKSPIERSQLKFVRYFRTARSFLALAFAITTTAFPIASHAIIGGQDVNRKIQPESRSVFSIKISVGAGAGREYDQWCTGTLIGERVLLTAAHCLKNITQMKIANFTIDYTIPQLEDALENSGQAVINIYTNNVGDPVAMGNAIALESNFSVTQESLQNDIALIRLSAPLKSPPPKSSRITIDSAAEVGLGNRVTGMGTGVYKVSGGQYIRGKLKEKQFSVVNSDGFNIDSDDLSSMLFFRDVSNEPAGEICVGDSGGPLIIFSRGKYKVVGVIDGAVFPAGQTVQDCQGNDDLMVASSVKYYANWIERRVAAWGLHLY